MLSFEAWLAKVDAIISSNYGVSIDDMPDCCYRDWYDSGVKPATAARRAIKCANE